MASQNARDRSIVLLATPNAYPLLSSDFATSVETWPVPIRRTLRDRMSSMFSSARRTAIEPTETPPRLMPVSLRMRAPALMALSKRVFRRLPDAPAARAAAIESRTCPSICSSPTTIESRPDVSLRMCSSTSRPPPTSRLPPNSDSGTSASDAHVLLMRPSSGDGAAPNSSTRLHVCSMTHSSSPDRARNSDMAERASAKVNRSSTCIGDERNVTLALTRPCIIADRVEHAHCPPPRPLGIFAI